ncbi:MAG: hypothetical protein US50_C0042G0002 [Candidatus Nomurabacteria bacterium GW2011_GWB1_37_5]|uniref:Uncharacterized protein n=1 Tax=Candidatus Nomurabacteria bacterium GW2011_GWB1_37_5 TaxID=1618742 RepID=A0A0G0GUD5_9BACT|nr:MAG: hypothetical protein US50_C0042G0002 [Candidatus Nomurabacteria bacterium GW2011_GWB1_37_5]
MPHYHCGYLYIGNVASIYYYAKNAIMETRHERLICDNKFALKEEQRDLLCRNKESHRCSSLCVKNQKIEEVRPILKNLISHIIKVELNNYLNNLHEKQQLTKIRPDL